MSAWVPIKTSWTSVCRFGGGGFRADQQAVKVRADCVLVVAFLHMKRNPQTWQEHADT